MAEISRQRKWQIKNVRSGNCIICGKPRCPESSSFCCRHWLDFNTYMANRSNPKHRQPSRVKACEGDQHTPNQRRKGGKDDK